MLKQLCLLHANCQGDVLHALLAGTPDFARHFDIRKYTNYLCEPIPHDELARCAVLLYQELDDKWGENASAVLRARLPQHALALKIPNMFFNGYWPLWTNATHMAYGDMLLEALAERVPDPAAVLRVCLQGDMAAKYDLPGLVAASQEREEAKEAGQVVTTLPLIREHWRTEQLFHTVNHPGPRLLLHVADGVLAALGFGPVPQSLRAALYAQQEDFEQPIHPQVGAFFGLPFALPERRYRVYGQHMTYAQYAAAYAACRLQKGEDAVTDFVVYLHLMAQQQQQRQQQLGTHTA